MQEYGRARKSPSSLANHRGVTIDQAIDFMGDSTSCFSVSKKSASRQLRQQLLCWSGHAASWLNQNEIPVHLIRYEDMKSNPIATIHVALEFTGQKITLDEVARAIELADFKTLKNQEDEIIFAKHL